ncbi:MAG: right-handed parallel beta-helix repeat-containing protein, partial [Microbacteriaceae bacterium]|nr:right-handed parallel beta-helix repeat-containing protein [Microbacteriaceae bacterium]
NSYFRIEYFANSTQDPQGYGEGRRFLGYQNIVVGAGGLASFGTTQPGSLAVGEYVSATATLSDATFSTFTDTSEFARTAAAVSSVQATLAVDTTADTADGDTTSLSTLLANKGADGFISLREAITAANNTANGSGGPDRIHFNIADALVGGAHTIELTGVLPALTDAVIIDGTTDSDFSTTPVIVLSGNSTGGSIGLQLSAGSSGSTIRGLVINEFAVGIKVDAGTANHLIAGNYIGTDVTGMLDRGNLDYGIRLEGSTSVVGGTAPGDRNLISGNGGDGILIPDASAAGNVIQGNYIGTNAAGTAVLRNDGDGLEVVGPTTIGGTVPAARTVISGNLYSGIYILSGSAGSVIQGNFIGTDAAGTGALGNGAQGIRAGTSNILIGGTAAGASNTIAFNLQTGVVILGGSNHTVLNNTIHSNAQLGIDI